MKRNTTVLKVAIHRPEDNPVFGTDTTHVSIDDLGGGPFIVIEQTNDEVKPGTVWLDFDELEAVVKVAKALRKGIES